MVSYICSMAENLVVSSGSKEQVYKTLIPQIEQLLAGETNLIANLANISSAIQMTFDYLWVGFYLKETEDQLVLGPFQGPVACTRIKKGQGVCGSAWAENKTFIVKNVSDFPGHIACSSASISEIVVPFYSIDEHFLGVLDIDSEKEASFDELDQLYLEKVVTLLSKNI